MLQSLAEVTLENNPIEKNVNLVSILKDKFPGMKDYTPLSPKSKPIPSSALSLVKNESRENINFNIHPAVNTAAKKKAHENAVIKIIQKEWDKEMERLDSKKNGCYAKNPSKNFGDKSLVQSGHAEIESNRILYIYGNALEVL